MNNPVRRMRGTLVLALVVAAGFAGAAAAERPNDRAGALGVGATAASVAQRHAVIPNDRGGLLGIGAIETPAAAATSTDASVSAAASDEGFQWGDAALGAATALGVVLLGLVGFLAARQRTRMVLP